MSSIGVWRIACAVVAYYAACMQVQMSTVDNVNAAALGGKPRGSGYINIVQMHSPVGRYNKMPACSCGSGYGKWTLSARPRAGATAIAEYMKLTACRAALC